MLRSATFSIGVLLAVFAFIGFLMLGGMMAPPPYSVLVAVQDIPAYSTLDANALGVDAERINNQVAQTFVLREESEKYLGGFVLESIHAGEPLRKSAIVATANPEGINRLALVMTDPEKVAMVIPVDPKTAPTQIAPGDWVDLVIGLAPGNISAGSSSTFANLLAPPALVSPIVSFGPTPTTGPRSAPTLPPNPAALNPTSPNLSNASVNIGANDMNLPADKVVIQNVPVLAVRFQQVPNPAFTGSGAGLGQSQSPQGVTQSAYIQGDIQTITALVPRASVELLTFAKDNGRVHVVLLPARTAEAANGAQSPTFGVTFNDVLAWMMRERSQTLGSQGPSSLAQPTQVASTSQPAANLGTGQGLPLAHSGPSGQLGQSGPTGGSQPPLQTPRAPANPSKEASVSPAMIPTGLDFGALLVPLLCGVVLLVVFVAVVRFIRMRRRDSGLV